MKRLLPLIAVPLALSLPAVAHETVRHADAHVHGKAKLTLALKDNQLSMSLFAPSANFTTHDTKTVFGATNESGALFLDLPKSAKCDVGSLEMTQEKLGQDDSKDHAHHDDDHAGHDDHDKHDHDHDLTTEHSETQVDIVWNCQNPGKLKSISLNIFDSWAGFKEVESLYLTGSGANAAILTPSKTKIDRP